MADSYYDNINLVIEDCVKRDKKAQEILYKKFYGYALSVSLLYCANREDAVETVNDSFMKVFSKIGKFDRSKSFKAWLRKIVINSSIDKVRKQTLVLASMEDIPAETSAVTAETLSYLSSKDIIAMVNNLPQIHKLVFCLFDMEGFSHEEIAKRLSISESSSRVYLTRARKRLRELYHINFNDII